MKHIKTILYALFAVLSAVFIWLFWKDRKNNRPDVKKKRYLYIGLAVVTIAAIPVTMFFDKVKFFVLTKLKIGQK